MGEPIWVYDVKYSVDTIQTRETIKVYGKDMIRKLLEKKYPNCNIEIHKINDLGREK